MHADSTANISRVYLVLSAVSCMSELGIILSVVSSPLGHTWCLVTNTQDLSCEPQKGLWDHASLRGQCISELGALTRSDVEEGQKAMEGIRGGGERKGRERGRRREGGEERGGGGGSDGRQEEGEEDRWGEGRRKNREMDREKREEGGS